MRALRVLAALALSGCYGVPVLGPYRCDEGSACSDPSLVCDDGVCCSPTGSPLCRSFVLDGGSCANGASPKTYFQDFDGDGYGDASKSRPYCAQPVFDPYIEEGGDCDDTNPSVHPGSSEECNGLDDDCDGVPDNGLPLQAFFADKDRDDYGDPADQRSFCAAPYGWLSNNGDCNDDDPNIHPGAKELCDGVDDDCDNQVDDSPVQGMGGSCDVPGKQGVCKVGRLRCVAGAPVCEQVDFPTLDVCDGLDNNCEGQTDEHPDCGGPLDLLAVSTDYGRGAQNVGSALNGAFGTATCIKNRAGSVGETWSSPNWGGAGSNSHVFWVETSKTWDLSKPGLRLRLNFSYALVSPANPAWAPHGQPVIFLCGEQNTSFIRYVHSGGSALTNTGSPLDATIPIAGSPTWLAGSGSSLDLTRVKRLEILVQPNWNSPAPTFSNRFRAGFGFNP
ncbi:MAG: putative metal-binding motif-containing protein [Myxococcaceae bacterium]